MEKFKNLPFPFNFYRMILNGDHLHFGLWPDNDHKILTMEEAQQNMFEYLASYLPPPPARILDVGFGIGLSAYQLYAKGYKVVAIAPSIELVELARSKYGSEELEFIVLDYFSNDDRVFKKGFYDVIFFQEVMQYLHPLTSALAKAHYLLRDNGRIIIGDEICYDNSIRSETAVHGASDLMAGILENGFLLKKSDRISKNAEPTCDFVISGFEKNRDKILTAYNYEELYIEQFENLLKGWKKQKKWHSSGKMGYEIFVAQRDKYFIRNYLPSDRKKIFAMFKESFGKDRRLDHWNWKYRDNPYGSYNISIATFDNDTLVAHYAGYPVPLYSLIVDTERPKAFVALHIGDTMTNKHFRHVGVLKTNLLSRTVAHFHAKFRDRSFPFTFGFNTGSIKLFGMRYLGIKYPDTLSYWVRSIIKKPFEKHSLFFKIFNKYKIKEERSIGKEWDQFFDRVSPAYKFLIHRCVKYMRWRYLHCPDGKYRIFSIRENGKLIGWSVFKKENRKLIWGDALFDNKHQESVSYFLNIVMNKFFPDIESIHAWFSQHPDWWNVVLINNDFDKIPEPNGLSLGFSIRPYNNCEYQSEVEGLKTFFYFTMGDSDLF